MQFVIEIIVTDGSIVSKFYPAETTLNSLLNEFTAVQMLTLVQSAELYSIDDDNVRVTLNQWTRLSA